MTETQTESSDKERERDENGRFVSQSSNKESDSSDFEINFKEIPDETTQKAVKKLMEEREELRSQVSEVSTLLKQMNEREQQLQLEKVRAEKLGELRSIDPRLAEKYKDVTDLDKIDLLIDTAKSFKSNFAEYQSEADEGNKPKIPPSRIDLRSGDFV